jgi:hypothetical protein
MHDGVALANVGQELVAQAFTFARASYKASNIDKGNGRRNDFLGIIEPC